MRTLLTTDGSICGLTLDAALAGSVEQSQRWILTAMGSHGNGVVTMLWRILGNEQDVCDVYQQTFLQLAHLQDCKKPQNVAAYLYRTAANVAISMLRRRKLWQRTQPAVAAAGAHEVDYAHDLDAKHLQQKLRSAIARLPEYLREVIALRDLAEMPYSQVAKILGITASSARAYRSKAVTLLAAWMAKNTHE